MGVPLSLLLTKGQPCMAQRGPGAAAGPQPHLVTLASWEDRALRMWGAPPCQASTGMCLLSAEENRDPTTDPEGPCSQICHPYPQLGQCGPPPVPVPPPQKHRTATAVPTLDIVH